MSGRRTDMHRLQDLVRYHRMGLKKHHLAKLLRMSPNTERTYREALNKEGLLAGDPADLPDLDVLQKAVLAHVEFKPALQQASTVEPFRHEVETLLKKGAGPTAIFDKLKRTHKEGHEPVPSLSALKRFARAWRKAQPRRAEDVILHVHTEPGHIAQVDFGFVGKLIDPVTERLRQAYVFVMVLAFSRHLFAKVVFDQKATTFIQCHLDAFEAFGGVPHTLVPDNLKAAVIKAAFGEEVELNRAYREMARHVGCLIDPAPPYTPTAKGKVEAGVKYVKNNFFKACTHTRADAVQQDLDDWVEKTAGRRIHGTTGRVPLEVFEGEERAALLALPKAAYELLEWKVVAPRTDCHVHFDGRFYSYPWKLETDTVELWVQASPHTVIIWADHERVATHDRRGPGRFSTNLSHLPAGRAELAQRDIGYWLARGEALSPTVGAFLREVAEQDAVLSPLRTVQAMVRELEKVGVERAERACVRAQHFGVTRASHLKRMLQQGLEAEVLAEADAAPAVADGPTPQFARPVTEFAQRAGEVVR